MRTFIDNTGLHAAGRCLDGNALGDVDIRGLLQLATELVFSESVVVSGFEYEGTKEKSRIIRRELRRLGMPTEGLLIRSYRPHEYTKACRTAADIFSHEFCLMFPPAAQDDWQMRAARPDLLPQESAYVHEVHQIVTGDLGDSDFQRLSAPCLAGRAASSIAYMLTTNDSLLQQVCQFAAANGWAESATSQLIAMLRYYANQELAGVKQCVYAPAVARAQLVRRCSHRLTDALSGKVSKAASLLVPRSLGVPGVAGALLIRSRGDPRGVIQEAVALREKASDLRQYLMGKLNELDVGTPVWNHAMTTHVKELARVLGEDLHSERRPHWTDALQVHFGPPFISLDLAKFRRWRESAKLHERVSILTELSLSLAYADDELSLYQRLMQESTKGISNNRSKRIR